MPNYKEHLPGPIPAGEQPYLDLLARIMSFGTDKGDRTGTGTRSIFGPQMEFDLSKGFPLLTTKFVSLRLIASELVWFLKGGHNIKDLHADNNHIWDEWADATGDVGSSYGVMWRSWPIPSTQDWRDDNSIDQLANVIQLIKNNPDSRRLLVTAWNPAELDNVGLPWCHAMFQFYVANGKLSCKLYQRSADMFLGVPFNIASYALLTHMVAQVCDLRVGRFIWSGGDTHIYSNHFEQVQEQLSRTPFELPKLLLNPSVTDIDKFTRSDVQVLGYSPHPPIKAPVAV